MYYYMVHIDKPLTAYSFAVKSEKPLSDKEIILLCTKEKRFHYLDDASHVNFIERINEFDYMAMR